ncbi:hypothetical protein ASPVEDRAFT_888160 [Aspergillus versicolor CBS 583.65]|uniref:Ig-like domain-containing protein n=1 Tax=Aspergillus versicolor CBS 583.65 TaxID=1036611 RepID=A0A1L9PL78_ASPVE|nr:uncharacterized protein ASPVEDRAFT_888160 [Aspergillus versicolor CBS 583.65]OJJ02243.1 hypothetical protein ASPVEDRAFT_888160 [Aspergillus versicolor CBS 583.65]
MSRLSLSVFSILLLVAAMNQFTFAEYIECNIYPLMNWTEQDYEIDRRGPHPDLEWCRTSGEITRLQQWPHELRDRAPKRFDLMTGTTYCYPSSGGRENAWCDQLRVYGGNWYGCNLELPMEERQLGCPSLATLEPDLSVRRLVVTETDTPNVYILPPNPGTGELPEDAVARMKITVSEKEQIELLGSFGAIRCTNISTCPPLDDLKYSPVEWAAKHRGFKIPDGWSPT